MEISEAELDKIIVIKSLINRGLRQKQAAEQLKLSDRQIRRMLVRYKQEGAAGIKAKHRGGNRQISNKIRKETMAMVREHYHDFGPTFAAEKLDENGLKISRETLRKWMMEEGLWKGRNRKLARIHQCRERRSRFGELIQIDGSHHDWFEGRSPKCCLLVFIDDATSRIIGLRFEERETTIGYMKLISQTIQVHGRPVAYYNDKHSIFKTTRDSDNFFRDTQLVRALRELQIEDICAHSPQAKGRVERANQTLQDRLIKEMRLKGICSIAEANAYLPEFIADYNKRFSVTALSAQDAHRPLHHSLDALKRILSVHATRKLSKNLEFSHNDKKYQIKTPNVGYRLRYKEVTVVKHMDGSREVLSNGKPLVFTVMAIKNRPLMADAKDINIVMDKLMVAPQTYELNSMYIKPLPKKDLGGLWTC